MEHINFISHFMIPFYLITENYSQKVLHILIGFCRRFIIIFPQFNSRVQHFVNLQTLIAFNLDYSRELPDVSWWKYFRKQKQETVKWVQGMVIWDASEGLTGSLSCNPLSVLHSCRSLNRVKVKCSCWRLSRLQRLQI